MQQALDGKGRIYYIDENGNKVQPQGALNPFQKFGRNLIAKTTNLGSFLNESNPDSDMYKQKTNIGLALATLPIGGGVLGANIGKALVPFLGKKIGQMVGESAGAGFLGGSVEGFGRGLIEQKNPIKTAVQDGTIGLVAGGLGGLGVGKIGKYYTGQKVKQLQGKNDLTSKERKLINNYFADYERGINTVNKNDFIGKIELPSQGMKETIKQQPQKAGNVVGLSKALRNANFLEVVPERHKNKFGSDKFYHLENNKNEYIIANNPKNGKKYFHIIKDLNLAEPKSDGLSPTNSITDYDKNLKSFMKNSKVVDENGNPLVVYHGSNNDFDTFDKNKIGSNYERDKKGFFFTSNKNEADIYGETAQYRQNAGQKKTYSTFLNIENPYTLEDLAKSFDYSDVNKFIDNKGELIQIYDDYAADIIYNAEKKGNDGIIFTDPNDGYTLAVAFEPTQIKSVNNQGTFDPTNPNIYKTLLPFVGGGLFELLKDNDTKTNL